MPAPEPQDHLSKKSKHFTFTGKDGKTYTLPPVSDSDLSGGDYEDAILAGEVGMMAWMVKLLRSVNADPEALTALRALPQVEYGKITQAWAEHGDGDGASLGE